MCTHQQSVSKDGRKKKKMADIRIKLALWGFLSKSECSGVPDREIGKAMLETNRRIGSRERGQRENAMH
jgi:hypothetical protein